MLHVDIGHDFGPFQLDARFDAPAGVTAIFGPSGSGKSTLLNAVAGLFRPDRGVVRLKGRVLLDTGRKLSLPPQKRRFGVIFQDGRLFPHLNVRGNLDYGARFAPQRLTPEAEARVVEMLALGPLLRRMPATLSGGERQRVAIGRALLSNPEMILADEPLSALDEARKDEILPYFERLRDFWDIPMLYVSHDSAEIARLATTLVRIEAGRVIAAGPAGELLSDPALAGAGRDAGARIEARLVAHDEDGLSEFEAGGAALYLPHVDAPIGATLRLRIAAQDVMLARHRPEGISALNILPGTVRAVHGTGPVVTVQVATRAGLVLSRITLRSARALGISEGAEIVAIVKSLAAEGRDIGTTASR